jgi:organic radical activating enzyme
MCIQGSKSGEGKDLYPWNDPKNEIGIADWGRLMDQTAVFSPFLSVSGGEPMIYSHFKEFVIEAKKRRFVFELVTNGTLLSRYADFVVEQGIEFVSVSLDGLEEQHDEIRGHPGAFRRTVEGLRALLEARKRAKSYSPVITVGFVVMKSNIHIMEQMAHLALDMGVDILLFQHLIFDSLENVAKHHRIMNPDWATEQGLNIVHPSMPNGEYFVSDIGQKTWKPSESASPKPKHLPADVWLLETRRICRLRCWTRITWISTIH